MIYLLSGAAVFILAAYAAHRRGALNPIIQFFRKTEMPIWLSILLMVAAGYGTYVIAPMINQDFEYQKNRSTHILQTVQQMNKLNVELAIKSRTLSNALFYSNNFLKEREDLLDKVVEFQWALIDIDTVLQRNVPGDNCVKNIDRNLSDLKRIAYLVRNPEDQEYVNFAAAVAARNAKECAARFYQAAKL